MLHFNLLTAVDHLSSFNELTSLYQNFSDRIGFLVHSLFTGIRLQFICEQLLFINKYAPSRKFHPLFIHKENSANV